MFLCALFALWARGTVAEDSAALLGNVQRGWRVFKEKRCIECHAVWNLGGKIGPDLGRAGGESLTASDLAGMLWNHIPRMHSHMVQKRVSYPVLSLREVSDLFSFLYFARQLEERGDPVKGERTFREKGCAGCHFAEDRAGGGPGLSPQSWTAYSNPIVWTHKMWEHAPQMERAMKEAGVVWPRLDDADFADIIAYVRSLGGHETGGYLRPGSVREGQRLLEERGCRTCHVRGGPAGDLTTADLPRTVAGLASSLWNHSPDMTREMRERGMERGRFTPQEMADIVSCLLVLRQSRRAGDIDRGRRVFVERGCTECHDDEDAGGDAAPGVQKLSTVTTPVAFAHAVWNHGVPMLNVMSGEGSGWPLFQRGDVTDLTAYLKSLGGPSREPSISPSHRGNEASPVSVLPTPRAAARVGPPVRPGASCANNTCHPSVLAARQVHAPTAQGECDACHRLLDPQRHAFALVSETSNLCYRCHDAPGRTAHRHDPVDVSVCTACHEPHGAENLSGPKFTGDELCFGNMLGMTSALATLVSSSARETPPANPDVTPPNESDPRSIVVETRVEPFITPISEQAVHRSGLEGAAGAPLSVEEGCLAGGCHVDIVAGPVVHAPLTQQQCDACHRSFEGNGHAFRLTASEPDLCYQCHEQIAESREFVHGPVGLGLCTPCHAPHSAPHTSLLRKAGSERCFECHSELEGRIQAARVPHKPVTESERGCLSCHHAHRSEFKFQLRETVPDLCYTCHPEMREQVEQASVSHGALAADKPCGHCHDVHGSSLEKILVDTEMNLCLGCHDRPMETENGTIVDMKSWIEANPERHGPIREGLCTGCHLPHGSQNFRILRHSFPREFYRPFSVETYALCFDCHEQSIVLDPRTTALTAFRNGDKNLHYIHVNQEKGRTCRACHEVHAGTRPKRMKDFVPFGKWKYPVGFEETADGGRCSPGCHLPRAYSRNHEIVQK